MYLFIAWLRAQICPWSLHVIVHTPIRPRDLVVLTAWFSAHAGYLILRCANTYMLLYVHIFPYEFPLPFWGMSKNPAIPAACFDPGPY